MKFTPLQGAFLGRIRVNGNGEVMVMRLRRDTDATVARQRRATNATATRRSRGKAEGGLGGTADWCIAKDRPEKILH